MGLDISAGRIVMTDGSGNTRFDTNEGLFIPIEFQSGSYLPPTYSAQTFWDGSDPSSHSDVFGGTADNTYDLATISSDADTVRGAFNVTTSYGGFSSSRWYNASGSYVHMWQGGAYGSPVLVCGSWDLCAAAVYTFFCDSGKLKLREQIHIYNEPGYCIGGANTNTLFMNGPTFTYKLFCGTFV